MVGFIPPAPRAALPRRPAAPARARRASRCGRGSERISSASAPYRSRSSAGVRFAEGPSYTTCPARSATVRGQYLSATLTWCSDTTTVQRSSRLMRARISITRRDDSGSSEAIGSSASTTLRALHQRARDRRALLLAAGQRRSALQRAVLDADAAQRFQPRLHFVPREQPRQAAPQRHAVQAAGEHVGDHRQPADQVELLEHEADAGAHLADVGATCGRRCCTTSPCTRISPLPRSQHTSPATCRAASTCPSPRRRSAPPSRPAGLPD